MNSLTEALNSWGSRLSDFALPMFAQSSLLIILLFALDLGLRNRVRAAVRYALWILVLVKLVLPPSFAAPTSLAYWVPRKESAKATPAPPAQFVVGYSDARFDTAPGPPSLPARGPKLQFAGWLLLGWLAIALALTAGLVRRSRFVSKAASRALPASDSPEQLLEACRQQIRVRRVRLKLSATAGSPAVCGLWRPVILLPQQLADKLSALQLRAVLLHELAHIKRGDVRVHYAQTLLQILYWWHPLLWFANAQIRRVREQAVDEAVVVAMGSEAEVYPATLVEVAKFTFKRPTLALGLIGIVESKSALSQRIRRLLDQPMPKSARLGFARLIAVALTAAVLLPMARGERKPGEVAAQSAIVNPLDTSVESAGPKVGISSRSRDAVDAAQTSPTNSRENQLANTATSGGGEGTERRFTTPTGQDVVVEAVKPGGIQYDNETGICVVTNDFVIRFDNAVLTARRGQINTRTGEVTAEGGFTLKLRDQEMSGERLQYNFIRQKIASAPKNENDQLAVTIDKSGNLYLGSKRVTLEELKTQFEQATRQDPEVTLAVRADQEAPFGEVVKVMDAAKETGIKSVKAFTPPRRDKVPVLGDLPFFGRLFRSEDKPNRVGRAEIQSSLNRIILPQVVSDNMRLPDVLQWLSKQTREHDPEGHGINFVIGAAEQAAPMIPATVDPLTGKTITLPTPPDMSTVVVRINPGLSNVRLSDVIEAIVKVADKPIQYSIEDYGVVFSPKPPETTQLETRTFQLNPGLFLENLRKQMPSDVSTNVQDWVRRFFDAAGVNVRPPNAVFYNDRKGLLMIRATAKELEIVQNSLALFNYSPPQITIEAKFVEVGGKHAKELGLDWFLGNLVLANGTMSVPNWPPGNRTNDLVGILTASQVKVVFKTIEQRAGTDILSAPKVTTLSGRQAGISALQTTEVSGKALQTGPALKILPLVSTDGITLNLDAYATVTDVLDQGGIRRVRTRKVQGSAAVYDGQTLVLIDPMVPTSGLPGNPRTSKSAVPEDTGKRLLVFITPTLIDPAGNPIHAGDNLPFDPNSVPPQSSR